MNDTKREHQGRVVRKEIRIAATPEEVYEAWADPAQIASWFVDSAVGRAEEGEFMTWIFEHFGYQLPIPVVEAVPGERLVFAGELPGRPPFLQEIFIERDGEETVLRLANSGFGEGEQWDDEYEGVDSGWIMALTTLKHWLERHKGEARTHVLAMSRGQFEYEGMQPLFTTAEGLQSWLGSDVEVSKEPLGVGDRVKLELGELGPLEGTVLARSSRELLLDWPQGNGVLGLKAFSMGSAGRAFAVDLNTWNLPDGEKPKLEAFVTNAVNQLAPLVTG